MTSSKSTYERWDHEVVLVTATFQPQQKLGYKHGLVSPIQLSTNTHNEEVPTLIQSLKYALNTQFMYPLPTHLYTPMVLTVCGTRINKPFSAASLLT